MTKNEVIRIECFKELKNNVKRQQEFTLKLYDLLKLVNQQMTESYDTLLKHINEYLQFVENFSKKLEEVDLVSDVNQNFSPYIEPFISDFKKVMKKIVGSKESLTDIYQKTMNNKSLFENTFQALHKEMKQYGVSPLFLTIEQFTIHFESRIVDILKYTDTNSEDKNKLLAIRENLREVNIFLNDLQQKEYDLKKIILISQSLNTYIPAYAKNLFLMMVDCVTLNDSEYNVPGTILFYKESIMLAYLPHSFEQKYNKLVKSFRNVRCEVNNINQVDYKVKEKNGENFALMKFTKIFSGLSKLKLNKKLHIKSEMVSASSIREIKRCDTDDSFGGLTFKIEFNTLDSFNGSITFQLTPRWVKNTSDYIKIDWPFPDDYNERWNYDDNIYNINIRDYLRKTGIDFMDWFASYYSVPKCTISDKKLNDSKLLSKFGSNMSLQSLMDSPFISKVKNAIKKRTSTITDRYFISNELNGSKKSIWSTKHRKRKSIIDVNKENNSKLSSLISNESFGSNLSIWEPTHRKRKSTDCLDKETAMKLPYLTTSGKDTFTNLDNNLVDISEFTKEEQDDLISQDASIADNVRGNDNKSESNKITIEENI